MSIKTVFLKTKGQTCKECGGWAEKGEPAVRMRFIDAGGFYHIYHWHIECYPKHIEKKIEREAASLRWRKELAIKYKEKEEKRPRGRPKKKRGVPGRPRKSSTMYKERRRLLFQLCYHRSKGHQDRVDELRERMEMLEKL